MPVSTAAATLRGLSSKKRKACAGISYAAMTWRNASLSGFRSPVSNDRKVLSNRPESDGPISLRPQWAAFVFDRSSFATPSGMLPRSAVVSGKMRSGHESNLRRNSCQSIANPISCTIALANVPASDAPRSNWRTEGDFSQRSRNSVGGICTLKVSPGARSCNRTPPRSKTTALTSPVLMLPDLPSLGLIECRAPVSRRKVKQERQQSRPLRDRGALPRGGASFGRRVFLFAQEIGEATGQLLGLVIGDPVGPATDAIIDPGRFLVRVRRFFARFLLAWSCRLGISPRLPGFRGFPLGRLCGFGRLLALAGFRRVGDRIVCGSLHCYPVFYLIVSGIVLRGRFNSPAANSYQQFQTVEGRELGG